MDEIRRGEIFYIARGGGRRTEVSNMRTDLRLWSAMMKTIGIPV